MQKGIARARPFPMCEYKQIVFLVLNLIGILLLLTSQGKAQENYPGTTNPHGDFTAPAIPAKGIIGVALHVTAERVGDPAGLFIRATHPAGPATKAGLAHGQEILAVDGISIAGKTYREVVNMIRGEVGQPVRLTLKTYSEVQEITLTRVSEEQLLNQQQT